MAKAGAEAETKEHGEKASPKSKTNGTPTKVESDTTAPQKKERKMSLLLPLSAVVLSVLGAQLWEQREQIKSIAHSFYNKRSLAASSEVAPISLAIGNYTQSPQSHWDEMGSHFWSMKGEMTLERSGSCASPPRVLATQVDVNSVFESPQRELVAQNRVLVMRNGNNRGVLLEWDRSVHSPCLFELVEGWAEASRVDQRYVALGPRLYNQKGEAILSADGVEESKNIVYVLLDGQHWVWPGIKVGHTFKVDGVTLRTVSLTPKVFHLEGFLTPSEADQVREEGTPLLAQSTVVSDDGTTSVRKLSSARTSHTAYLHKSNLTRDFQYRTGRILRLPSPGYAESLQYVRYSPGQFYRAHYDYFEHVKILPDHDKMAGSAFQRYQSWAQWARDKVEEFGEVLSEDVRPGGRLYPDPQDFRSFQWELLKELLKQEDNPLDERWVSWVEENVRNGAVNIIKTMVESLSWVNEYLESAWQRAAGPHFADVFSGQPLVREGHPVAQYTRWIRWAKEQVFRLGDDCPDIIKPGRALFPSYRRSFMKTLAQTMSKYPELWTEEEIQESVRTQMAADVDTNRFLLKYITEDKRILSVAIKAFEKEAGSKLHYSMPQHVPWIEPNRFATIFMYLSDVSSGGQTVFPRAPYKNDRVLSDKSRELMSECEKGLAVPSSRATAALFYHKHPDGTLDPLSLHGGCPPAEGETKHGSNSFVWDVDYLEGVDFWGM